MRFYNSRITAANSKRWMVLLIRPLTNIYFAWEISLEIPCKKVIHGYEFFICLVLRDITDLYGFAWNDNEKFLGICLVRHENLSKTQHMDLSDFARNLFSNNFLHDITDLSGFAWNDNMDLSGYARNVRFCNGKTLGIYILLHESMMYTES